MARFDSSSLNAILKDVSMAKKRGSFKSLCPEGKRAFTAKMRVMKGESRPRDQKIAIAFSYARKACK